MATLKTLRVADFSRDIPTYSAGDGIEISDAGVISAVISDLSDYYTKSETYSKDEVNDLIDTINQFELVAVDELPTTGESDKLYLVPKEGGSSPNVKDEYVWLSTNAWEKIGDTEIDLSNYYTKDEVDGLLADKVDKEDGKGLSTNDYTNADKAIVDGVTDALADKVDKVEGKGLSTNDFTDADKEKLDSLKEYTAGENITISASGEISATDTTYEPATTTQAGLMSASDKVKLDGLEELTKANILSALGYEEIELAMTDTDGTTYTKTILSKIDE